MSQKTKIAGWIAVGALAGALTTVSLQTVARGTLAPLPLPDEIRDFVAEHVAISGLDLRSVMVPIKGGALQIGAVGRCAYTIARGDHAWAGALDLLARFAFYSGVGAGAARGFGQARLAPARPEIRPAVERRPAVA